MKQILSLRIGALLVTIAAACAPEGDLELTDPADPPHHEQPIVNGTMTTGYIAVGIVHGGGTGGCTGTMIAQDKVLTAAHCVTTKTKPYKVLYPINFYLGGFWGQSRTASSVAVHPAYDGGNKSDLAVFQLKKPITNVAPYGLASSAPKVGDIITIVGYGLPGDNTGMFGTKRQAKAKVSQVLASVFAMSGGTGAYGMVCNGDSGGPSFATQGGQEVIVGVHSTSAAGCASYAVDMRVDAYRQWITTLKITKKVYGSTCLNNAECLTGICMPSGSSNICTQECDTKACPNADKCLPYMGSEATKVCLPGSGTPLKKLGEICSLHADCTSNICAAISAQKSICSQICEVAKQNCPDGYYCISSTMGGLCIPGKKPAFKQLGENCSTDGECLSQFCAKMGTTAVCASWCDLGKAGACPTGFKCTPVAGKTQGLCLKDKSAPSTKKAFGASCTKDDECDSGMCASDGAGTTFCTAKCDPAAGCTAGEGYDCVPAGPFHVCAPGAGTGDDGGGGGSGCAVGPAGATGAADTAGAAGRVPTAAPVLLLVGVALLALVRRRG
jgi:V8-like Glu-specific endopeptidase